MALGTGYVSSHAVVASVTGVCGSLWECDTVHLPGLPILIVQPERSAPAPGPKNTGIA